MVDIVLPFSADGFYRFGDLAAHIARALVPPQENDGDWLLSVTCWKDDGSAEGLFTRRLAPEGTFTVSLEDTNAWPAETIDISGEPADRACSHLFTLMWHAKRQPPERHRYMLDGSLVIDTMCDCSKQVRNLTSYQCVLSYQSTLAEAVATGTLEVCDSFGLPLKFKHGQTLLDGVVHIDSLNAWGGLQPGRQCFKMAQPIQQVEATLGEVSRQFVTEPWPVEVPSHLSDLVEDNPDAVIGFRNDFGRGVACSAYPARDYLEKIEGRLRRQAVGFFTVEEAAAVMAKHVPGTTNDDWAEDMQSAHRAGVLPIRHSATRAPMRPCRPQQGAAIPLLWTTQQEREWASLDLVSVADIDAWLADRGVGYSFPQRTLETHSTVDVDRQQSGFVAAVGANDAQNGDTLKAPPIDFRQLADPSQLIRAFGTYTGMNESWFSNLKDKPRLLEARRFEGKGGRRHVTPWFCPFEVMQWLIDSKRKVGKPMAAHTGWRMLRQHWPNVYEKHIVMSPLED